MKLRSFWRACTNQNEKEWAEQLKKAEPKKYEKLLKAFCAQRPDTSQGQKKGASRKDAAIFSICQYRQQERASTGLRYQGVGVMMTYPVFEEHCKSTAGGRLSANEAKAKWDVMMQDNTLHDDKGPGGVYLVLIS